jgi:hypothetical protein
MGPHNHRLNAADKAAQTGVQSSPKQGVMQAVDRELPVPAQELAFTVELPLHSLGGPAL